MGWMYKQIWACFFVYSITLPIIHGNKFEVVNVSSLVPTPYCQRSNSAGLKLVPAFGPCNSAKAPSSDKVVGVCSIETLGSSELRNSYGEYHVKIGLGTPQQNYMLTVDTGSSLIWVRCDKSKPGYFDPLKSFTYNTNSSDSCHGSFNELYADKSYSSGNKACDTLTLDGVATNLDNFVFGCGLNYDDTSFDNVDGILGLGRGDTSLPSQLFTHNPSIVNMFSYCIPLTGSQEGNLRIGDEAKTTSSSYSNKFTPLLQGNDDNYYVDLVGISVNETRLQVLSKSYTSRGTIIDSGTTITRLPQDVYYALRTAFRNFMSKYKYEISDQYTDELMDTCYNIQGLQNIHLPKIQFHFREGTDVTLSNNGIIWIPHDNRNVACFAFAAKEYSESPSIIGNVQQRGFNVLYDLEAERIGFGPTDCAT